jgi:hypothetical protein
MEKQESPQINILAASIYLVANMTRNYFSGLDARNSVAALPDNRGGEKTVSERTPKRTPKELKPAWLGKDRFA